MELSDVKKVDNRWFPMTVVYKDMLKDGKGTEFKMTSVKFDQQIPEYIFTKAALNNNSLFECIQQADKKNPDC